MKKYILSLFFIGIASFVFAKEIAITVLDKEIDFPLEGVAISTKSNKESFFTDINGVVKIDIKSEEKIIVQLIGYKTQELVLKENQDIVVIYLETEDIVLGEELVVTEKYYDKTDEKSSVSVSLTKENITNTSQLGLFPDVMTSVKTLPGVTYSGAFSQKPSVRGGYPYELSVFLDGLYVYAPFHWKGAVSIFDPAFVNSLKLSHGVYSANFGHGTSGLLDISSIDLSSRKTEIEANLSLLQSNFFIKYAPTSNFMFVAGVRGTLLEPIPYLYDNLGITGILQDIGEFNKNLQDIIARMPYLRDGYVKFLYEPLDRLNFDVNLFYGAEGVQVQTKDEESYIEIPKEIPENTTDKFYSDRIYTNKGILNWDDWFIFGSFITKWLPTDKIQLKLSSGVNYYNNTVYCDFLSSMESRELFYNYTYQHSYPNPDSDDETDWITTEVHKHQEETIIDDDGFYLEEQYYIKTYQTQLHTDWQLSKSNLISFGVEEFIKQKTFTNTTSNIDYYYKETNYFDEPTKNEIVEENNTITNKSFAKGNNIFNTNTYLSWQYGDNSTDFQTEIGLRMEHYYLNNDEDTITINMLPTFNPRATIQYTPFKSKGIFDKVVFSAGFGLFSLVSEEMMSINSRYRFVGTSEKPDQNLFGILGTKVYFLDGYNFQLETYYKHYFNRFYAIEDESDSSNPVYKYFNNGKGNVFGIDLMLEKEKKGIFDGYLTYSFIYARFKNPYKEDFVGQTTTTLEPLGINYYPYYHRFHSLNYVLNFTSKKDVVFSLNGSIISGTPQTVDFDWNPEIYDEKIYSDKARNSFAFPLNLRIGVKRTFKKWENLHYEWYFAFENILGLLNKSSVVGNLLYEEDTFDYARFQTLDLANLDLGIPLFTIGFKISY